MSATSPCGRRRHADEHEQAQLVFLEVDVDVDAVDPLTARTSVSGPSSGARVPRRDTVRAARAMIMCAPTSYHHDGTPRRGTGAPPVSGSLDWADCVEVLAIWHRLRSCGCRVVSIGFVHVGLAFSN
jgi:hypothetical protein